MISIPQLTTLVEISPMFFRKAHSFIVVDGLWLRITRGFE